MIFKVNRYIVNCTDANREHLKSQIVFGMSEEEVFERVRNDKFWYNEGSGIDAYTLVYPLNFEITKYKSDGI